MFIKPEFTDDAEIKHFRRFLNHTMTAKEGVFNSQLSADVQLLETIGAYTAHVLACIH